MHKLVQTAVVQVFLGRPDFCHVVWGLFFFLMPHLQNGFGRLRKGTPLLFIPSVFTCPIATAVLVGKIDLTRCKIMLCIQRQRCTSFHFNIYFKSKLCWNLTWIAPNGFAKYSELTEAKLIHTSYTQLLIWFLTAKTSAKKALGWSKWEDTGRSGLTGRRIVNKREVNQQKHSPHQMTVSKNSEVEK